MVSRPGDLQARWRLGLASVVVVLLTALALVLAVRAYHRLLGEGFRERSIAYTQAFAASATSWLDPPNAPMLRAASRFMLVGSALFVQVVFEDGPVIEERGEAAAEILLVPVEAVPSLSAESARSPTGNTYLDIVAQLPSATESAPEGYVRVGIDASSVISRGRSTTALTAGLGLVFDALIILLLHWVLRGRRPRGEKVADTTEPPIAIGDLLIDPSAKEIRFEGAAVSLTPKQYTLLAFLAQQPGHVYSEREIVSAVWSESPYADSKDVKQYVYLVRQRLAAVDPRARDLIVTVPGFGYKLVSEVVDEGLTAP